MIKCISFLTVARRGLLRILTAAAACFLPVWTGMPAAQESLPSGLSHDFSPSGFLSDTIVKDHFTGLALGGVDPLSYFVSGRPELGKPEHDLTHSGALWWFSNIGNKAAFEDAPNIYMPQFGGYGAMAVARGGLAEGRPQIWLLQGDMLLLFHSQANRIAWRQNQTELLQKARDQWPSLIKKLVP